MVFAKGQSGNPAKMFKKGVVANPKGRPVGAKTLKNRLTQLLERTISYKDFDESPIDIPIGDAIAMALIGKAIYSGDVKAIEMIRNEVEGNMPKDAELSDTQKMIVQRAFQRITEMKDVSK